MPKFNYLEVETLYQNGVSMKDAIPLGQLKEGQKISIMSNSMKNSMLNKQENIKYSCCLIEEFVDATFEELLENMHLSSEVVPKDLEKEKNQSCDFVAVLGDKIYNIEINNNTSLHAMERNLHYVFRLYAKKVVKGSQEEDYDYTNVLQLNLNNFAPVGEDKTVDVFFVQNKDGKVLTDKLIFVQIYIPNIKRKCYNESVDNLTKLERRILTMAEEDIELSKELGRGDKVMEEYINDAIFASGEDDLREAYDKEWALKDQGKREGMELGRLEGRDEGRAEGAKSKAIEIAKNLLRQNIEDAIILNATGLSMKELQKLKTSI